MIRLLALFIKGSMIVSICFAIALGFVSCTVEMWQHEPYGHRGHGAFITVWALVAWCAAFGWALNYLDDHPKHRE